MPLYSAGLDETLTAIDKLITATTVDVFVYDTSKDSDGGAWRDRTSHTSWYQETLNTATRGATEKFPALAIIVAETTKVTIYDATDSAVPMWMVFSFGHAGGVTSVVMLNSKFVIGNNQNVAQQEWDFIADSLFTRYTFAANTGLSPSTINERTSFIVGAGADEVLVDWAGNDVAMTVLPNAPIDPATGLPIPTIAVATDGGVSVINDDGNVWDIVYTSSTICDFVQFVGSGLEHEVGDSYIHGFNAIPTSDLSGSFPWVIGNSDYFYDSASAIFADIELSPLQTTTVTAISRDAYGLLTNLALVKPNLTTPAEGMVNYTTKDSCSGWMQGDIKGAWLANSKTTDRSVKANTLTETGTVTESAVATGTELNGYSGFSGANYLSRVFDADLDFSTAAFHGLFWLNQAATAVKEQILDRDTATTAQRFAVQVDVTTSYLSFTCDDNTTTRTATGAVAVDDGVDHLYMFEYDGSGTLNIYQDGSSTVYATATGADLLTLNNATATLFIGVDADLANPLTNGSLSLLRMSVGNMSMEQWAAIYESEKYLFQDNAACTLNQSISAVNALAYDSDTEQLLVAGTDNLDTFQGLRRVASEVGVYTSLAAANGLVAKGN
jgi:hypothetical protein